MFFFYRDKAGQKSVPSPSESAVFPAAMFPAAMMPKPEQFGLAADSATLFGLAPMVATKRMMEFSDATFTTVPSTANVVKAQMDLSVVMTMLVFEKQKAFMEGAFGGARQMSRGGSMTDVMAASIGPAARQVRANAKSSKSRV